MVGFGKVLMVLFFCRFGVCVLGVSVSLFDMVELVCLEKVWRLGEGGVSEQSFRSVTSSLGCVIVFSLTQLCS